MKQKIDVLILLYINLYILIYKIIKNKILKYINKENT